MSSIPTEQQISAGGVAYRRNGAALEIALIRVSAYEPRWQLPKGIVEAGEAPETTARREVREEAGIETEVVAPIDTIEYWFYGRGKAVRYHKFVHFFLLRYVSGEVSRHDHEVLEARWVEIGEAQRLLAFPGERTVTARAGEMLRGRHE
ncbi:MAG: NUDIX domain-containing protein [Chloroflexi bacterium]|nr:NUDIX domain-containing protein [Chloroflexota bacterium]